MPRQPLDPAKALVHSEERLRLALEAANSGAWDWDIVRDVAEVSPSYRKLFELPDDANVDYHVWLSRVHPEDRERCRIYGECFFGGTATEWSLEFRIQTSQGIRWHRAVGKLYRDPDGKPLRFIGVSADVTDEQRALTALKESEERFRTMADGLPLIIWVHDQTGAQQFVNRTFGEFFGVDPAKMTGADWKALMHPEDATRYAEAFMGCLHERRPFHAEARVRNACGEWRTIESWGRPRWSSDGEFLGMVGTSADVTERRRLEQALIDADRRKDEFLAFLGHELRTPLAAIANNMEIMRRQIPASSTIHRVRETAERQCRVLSRLVDDLMDVARISTGKFALQPGPVTLQNVIRTAIESTEPEFRSREHTLRVNAPPHEINVYGDEVRLVQVLSNILNNAARYTPSGGVVSMTLEQTDDEASIRIRDNGRGIPPDKLESIFDAFFQGDQHAGASDGGGLGLGLALVKQIVRMHGGIIAVKSEGRGTGAEFMVRLPILVERNQADSPEGLSQLDLQSRQ